MNVSAVVVTICLDDSLFIFVFLKSGSFWYLGVCCRRSLSADKQPGAIKQLRIRQESK